MSARSFSSAPSHLALPGRNTRATVWRKHTEATRQTAPIPSTVMARALPRSVQPSKSHVNRHQETPSLVAIPLQIWNTPVRPISCMVFPSAQLGKEFAQLPSRIAQPVNNVRFKTSIGFHANPLRPIRQTVTNDEGFLEAIVSSPFEPNARIERASRKLKRGQEKGSTRISISRCW